MTVPVMAPVTRALGSNPSFRHAAPSTLLRGRGYVQGWEVPAHDPVTSRARLELSTFSFRLSDDNVPVKKIAGNATLSAAWLSPGVRLKPWKCEDQDGRHPTEGALGCVALPG